MRLARAKEDEVSRPCIALHESILWGVARPGRYCILPSHRSLLHGYCLLHLYAPTRLHPRGSRLRPRAREDDTLYIYIYICARGFWIRYAWLAWCLGIEIHVPRYWPVRRHPCGTARICIEILRVPAWISKMDVRGDCIHEIPGVGVSCYSHWVDHLRDWRSFWNWVDSWWGPPQLMIKLSFIVSWTDWCLVWSRYLKTAGADWLSAMCI